MLSSLTSSSNRITDTGPSCLKLGAFDLPRRCAAAVAVVLSVGGAGMAS
jgi:hypothetical protein